MRPLLTGKRDRCPLSWPNGTTSISRLPQCHLSPGLKMACEIKACLTGSLINASLNSCTIATGATAPLLFCAPPALLPPSLWMWHVHLQQREGNLKQEGFY